MFKNIQKNQIAIYVIAVLLVTAGYLNYIDRTAKTVSVAEEEKNRNENIGEATLVNSDDISGGTTLTNGDNISGGTTLVNGDNISGEEVASNNKANNNSVENNDRSELNNDEKNKLENKTEVSNIKANDANDSESSVRDNNKNVNAEYFVNSKLEREKMYSQMLETYKGMINSQSVSEEQRAVASQEIQKINDTKNTIMICENLILNKDFENVVIFVNSDSINVVVQKDNIKNEEIAQIQNIINREFKCSIDQIHIMMKNN